MTTFQMRYPAAFLGWCSGLVVALLAVAGPCSADSAPSWGLSVDDAKVSAGETVQVAIRASGDSGVGAAQLDLRFDPAVLDFRSVSPGPLLPSALLESRAASPGRVRVALASGEPVTGEGVLIVVQFTVRAGPPARTVVSIEDLRAWSEADVLPIVVSSRAGEVSRVERPLLPLAPGSPESDATLPAWVYALVGAAAVLVAGLVAHRLRRRKARALG
jgi:hypothetical protein